MLPNDPIPDWINDKPDIKFDSLSAVPVKITSAPQADSFGNFGPGVPNLDSYLRTEGASYQIVPGGLIEKAMPYTDRKYGILELPAPLKGATLLQTRNGHKGVTHPGFSIALEIEKPAYLFVAVDERMIRI